MALLHYPHQKMANGVRIFSLTDKGIAFARKNIDVVFKLEQKAFQKMGDEGFNALIESNRQFQELLRAETEQFIIK